jgi:hypothetical protein
MYQKGRQRLKSEECLSLDIQYFFLILDIHSIVFMTKNHHIYYFTKITITFAKVKDWTDLNSYLRISLRLYINQYMFDLSCFLGLREGSFFFFEDFYFFVFRANYFLSLVDTLWYSGSSYLEFNFYLYKIFIFSYSNNLFSYSCGSLIFNQFKGFCR